MNPNAVVLEENENSCHGDSWDEELVEDGETYFNCTGTCNRVMHYEDTNGEGMCGRCEYEDSNANYESSDEEDLDDNSDKEEETNEIKSNECPVCMEQEPLVNATSDISDSESEEEDLITCSVA